MKRLLIFATTLVALVAFCGCDKNKEHATTIEFTPTFQKNITAPAKGGSWEYNFHSTVAWSVTCDDDWVSIEPTSGPAGDGTFNLVVSGHDNGEERNSRALIKLANGEAYEISITQLMQERFDIAPTEVYTIGSEGGNINIDLATNIDYEIDIPEGISYSWISLDTTRAMRDETLTFTVMANTAETSRVVIIRAKYNIDNEDKEHLFAIVQDCENVALNEITYSSDNDEVVELTTTENFGSHFVLHFFDDAKRKGRIIFATNVRYIPESCFEDMNSITSITIPNKVEAIESRAFAGCTLLKEFTLPTDINRIGGSIFDGCELDTITCYEIPNQGNITCSNEAHWLYGSKISHATLCGAVGKSAFNGYAPLTTLTIDGCRVLGQDAFKECANIQSVSIPSEEYWYDMSIFNGSANPVSNGTATLNVGNNVISQVTNPADVTKIGNYLFTNYKHITSIYVGDEVTSVGAECFAGCDVESIYLGKSINTVGMDFLNECTCEKLTINFNIPDFQQSTTSSSHWFHGLNTPEIVFSNQVERIGNFALNMYETLSKVTIGDNVQYIGEGAFAECANLTAVTFGKGVKELAKHAFYGCKSLEQVSLPEGVTLIGNDAFNYCAKIKEITIPVSVTTIGEYAFRNCEALTAIYCRPTTPPTLGNEYVLGSNKTQYTIYVPAASKEAYCNAEYWSTYSDCIVESNF